MRTCIICHERPVYGRTYSYCRECQSVVAKRWRQENLAYLKEYKAQRFATRPARDKWNGHLIQRYGITADQYEAMAQEQKGVCAICYEPPARKRLSVDHCHGTGKVRGLLCERCNSFLGRVNDNAMILASAVTYLHDTTTSKEGAA